MPRLKFLNHPWTYQHPELGTPDPANPTPLDYISCDEYPFAATYESPGKAQVDGGKAPTPNGGADCVQTVAAKVDDGSEHLPARPGMC
ncbi:hypothetical protein [Streptomyces sp. NBC_01361]|uniref:hypothetical protein n=1 Tax=Streptomyces sp. NBC_01361 TaxID=2903838 RepID=UPI002E33A2D2|nr:hypothetical protein [Streptomyces sp. NBC_01361]